MAVWEKSEPGDKPPFVVDGGGALCGHNEEEHFQWALAREHPFIEKGLYNADTDAHFWSAIEFENTSTAEHIDDFRSEVITNYAVLAAELEDARVWWFHNKHTRHSG